MSLPISGFTAVPNPQMLAFMAAQSFVMMMQAGEGWQYGKRKQSAMTNEEFNKQTPLSIMQRQMSELKQAIPTIEQSMNSMTPMIKTIVEQYGDFIAEIIKSLPSILENVQGGQTLTGNISQVGQELVDIINNLIPKLPESVDATLYTNNPNYISSPSLTADEYAHTLGTHAGHTVGNNPIIQGPTEGPPAPPDYTPPDFTPPKPPVTIPSTVNIGTISFFPDKIGLPSTGQVRKYLTTLMRKNAPSFRILSFNIYQKAINPGKAHIGHSWKVSHSKLSKNADFTFVIPRGY